MMSQLYTISSGEFSATISSLGAELKSVQHNSGTEFMWQADPDIWPRTAPVLFPIVGRLKGDQLRYEQNTYPLTQHGFARDKHFTCISHTDNSIALQLSFSTDTVQHYPFHFKLILTYRWEHEQLICGYEVINADAKTIWFSIGAHPGLLLPVADLSQFTLEFNKTETAARYLLQEGLFTGEKEELLHHQNILPLHASLFDKDAIVFKTLASTQVTLKQTGATFSVQMDFEGFPQFAVWTKKGSQRFVCLEPWFGYADDVNGHTDLSQKPGILSLGPKETFKAHYKLSFTP